VQTLTGIYDGKEIIILYDGDDQPVYLHTRIVEHDLVLSDELVPRVKIASAYLASDVGTYWAMHFLHDNNVPPTSLLWDLNHTGYPGAAFFEKGPK
jgi:hypothetical protein